jgi:cytochrome c553
MPMRRGLFGRPKMPRGVGFGYGMPITKMDVRRTGIFGRPKEYTMEFGMPGAMPGMALPGYGQGFYGYGQTSSIKKGKSKGRIITETIAGTVNNEAIKEVADKTNSNAANTSAQNPDKDNNGVPDGIQANPEKKVGEDWIYNTGAAPESGVISNNPSTPGTTANNVQVNTATSNRRSAVDVNNEADDAVVNNSNEKREETKNYIPWGDIYNDENFNNEWKGIDTRYTKDRPNATYLVKDGKYYISPESGDNFYEVTDPARIEKIKKFKGDQVLGDQALRGSSYIYDRDTFGNWRYLDEKAEKYLPVTNPKSLDRLNKGENIYNVYATLDDKPGYYYRQRNDGAFVKFKGDPKKHNMDKKPIEVITKKDKKRWDYIENTGKFVDETNNNKKLNLTADKKKSSKSNVYVNSVKKAVDYNKIKNTGKDLYRSLPDADKVAKVVGWNKIKNTAGDLYNALPDLPSRQKFVDWGILADENDPTYKMAREYRQTGGFIDSENPNLYKFVYGGNDPYFTQEDLDDVYSKDISDPYFQDGGGYDDYRKKVGDKLGMSLRDDLSAKELFEMGQKAGISFNTDTPYANKKKTTTTDYEDSNPYPNVGYNGFNAFGNLFPASIASYQGSWAKTKRGPYNKATGMMMPGMGFGPNTQVSSIDVKRSGMFGRPKKYTVNFSNQQMDPRKQNLITVPGQGTPGSQGYSGQEPTVQGQSDRFSNTKGLKAGTRAKVAMKELFNRYSDEEEVPTGDVASTSNEPSPTQKPLSDEEEVAKFQQQQRKNGKRWDEEKQAWVDQEQIKMELNKPGKIGATKDIQARMDQEALSREAKESFGDYGDVSSELGDKNVQSEYQKIYESRGKEAAENFMDDQFTKRNNNIRSNEGPTSEEQAESLRQDIINNENMSSNPMFMGRRQASPEQSSIVQEEVVNPDAQVKQTPSFADYTGIQRFNPETGQEEEVVEDEESFGPVADNPFAPTSADDEAAGFGYDINAPQASQKRRSVFNRRSNQQQPSRNQSQKSNTPQTKTVTVTENGKKVQKQVPLTKEDKAFYDEEAAYLKEFDRDKRTESEKIADEAAYKKARIAEKQRLRKEANDPELQKQKRETEKIRKKESAAYKDLYEKPMEDLTRRRDLQIRMYKNNSGLTKEQRDRKITELEQWYQREEKKLSDKASEQRQWYNEEVNKGKNTSLSKKGAGYMSNVKQFGGDLRRFTGGMQQFPNGGSPVTFTDNPALVGMSNVDMISLNEGIPGLGQSSLTGFMNTNAPVRDQSQDPKEVKTDPTQVSSDQAKKAYQATPGDYSMDFKVKNTWEINPEAALQVANAGVRGATGLIDRFRNKDREARMYDNLTADNLYASDPSRDRGDYDANTGLYRPNEQGSLHTSRSAQYGGMIYQDGGYYDEEDDDVAYMTEDQIRQFLANGGEIEYL